MNHRAAERRIARARARAVAKSTGPSVSPLAPAAFPDLPDVAGLRLATGAVGVRYVGRTDVMLAVMAPGTTLAGAVTRSATRSAAVDDCATKLAGVAAPEAGAAILVNSGNANAFTGRSGRDAVDRLVAGVASVTDVPAERVLTASTGVIGEPLADDRIAARLDALGRDLAPGGFEAAARAIMTTDTFPKGAGRRVETARGPVAVAGIAKGSGMIAPDMGTMLVHIFTDARIAPDRMRTLVAGATDRTFNRITVDGDTSTSDTLTVAATGVSGIDADDDPDVAAAIEDVMRDLAQQVVRDGEGATKFVTVEVTGAVDDADARRVAGSIANSPLVKTAVAGEDPNWGRVVMAVGKSGARADRDRLAIRFGDITVARDGVRDPDYAEAAAAAVMRAPEITLGVDLGLGDGAATIWTCDLTDRYIAINADYRS